MLPTFRCIISWWKESERDLRVHFVKALILLWGLHPHELIISKSIYFLIPSHSGLGFQHMSGATNIQFIAPFSTLSASKEANICGPCQWSPLPSASVGFVQQEGMEGHHMVSTEQGRGISSSICLCPSMDVHSSWTSVFSCKCSLQYLVILPSHSCYSLLTIILGCFTVHYWVFLSLSHTFKKK